jgi:hypothetical protein
MTTSGGRPTNLIFEIKTDKRPGEPGYPFDLSREGLKDDLAHNFIVSTIENHTTNAITSQKLATEDAHTKTREIKKGHTVNGKREASGETQVGTEGTEMPTVGQILAAMQMGGDNLVREVEGNQNEVAMMFYDYSPPEDDDGRIKHAKLLRAWQEVLQLVALTDDSFGIGLTEDSIAERYHCDGRSFYLLKPSSVDDVVGIEAKVMTIWSIACHEVTHYHFTDHNENFTSEMYRIQKLTADVMWLELKRISKLLK